MTRCLLLLLTTALATPAPARPPDAGRVARSAIGEAGQRQTREQAAPGLEPMARLSNRIEIRVQNRLRTRIERDDDAQGEPARPFAAAEARMRAGRPRR